MSTDPPPRPSILSTMHATEIWLALWLFLYGAFLLLPFKTFTSSVSFVLLDKLRPEEQWGLTALVLSAGLVVGMWRGNSTLIKWTAFWSIVYWAMTWGAFLFGNPEATATPTYLIPVCMSGVVFVRQE